MFGRERCSGKCGDVVLDKLRDRAPEVALPQRNDSTETLSLPKTLKVWIY